jgi:hypothetical protein
MILCRVRGFRFCSEKARKVLHSVAFARKDQDSKIRHDAVLLQEMDS